jgi:hypothetical protein
VSIQLTPFATACWIAATEAASSCGPQAKAQPPPPAAQAPKPTVVISGPLEPSRRVGNCVFMASLRGAAGVYLAAAGTTTNDGLGVAQGGPRSARAVSQATR